MCPRPLTVWGPARIGRKDRWAGVKSWRLGLPSSCKSLYKSKNFKCKVGLSGHIMEDICLDKKIVFWLYLNFQRYFHIWCVDSTCTHILGKVANFKNLAHLLWDELFKSTLFIECFTVGMNTFCRGYIDIFWLKGVDNSHISKIVTQIGENLPSLITIFRNCRIGSVSCRTYIFLFHFNQLFSTSILF